MLVQAEMLGYGWKAALSGGKVLSVEDTRFQPGAQLLCCLDG